MKNKTRILTLLWKLIFIEYMNWLLWLIWKKELGTMVVKWLRKQFVLKLANYTNYIPLQIILFLQSHKLLELLQNTKSKQLVLLSMYKMYLFIRIYPQFFLDAFKGKKLREKGSPFRQESKSNCLLKNLQLVFIYGAYKKIAVL